MITFTIMLILAIVLSVILLTCGAGILAIFGDFIVFGLIIWLIVRLFRKK